MGISLVGIIVIAVLIYLIFNVITMPQQLRVILGIILGIVLFAVLLSMLGVIHL